MPNPADKKVLLIEDDQTMQKLLARLLEIEGFQILTVGNTSEREIAGAITTHQPFAMILDVHLENQNGLDLLKAVRANPATAEIKVIMTSGEDLRDQSLGLGANGFLLKPYTPSDLIAWLQSQYEYIEKKER